MSLVKKYYPIKHIQITNKLNKTDLLQAIGLEKNKNKLDSDGLI